MDFARGPDAGRRQALAWLAQHLGWEDSLRVRRAKQQSPVDAEWTECCPRSRAPALPERRPDQVRAGG